AHTIGQASSSAEPGDLDFLASLAQFCSNSPDIDNPLAPFDFVTPSTFDNQ
ncbi:hypothetical protein MKW98_000306, partial [Papaver atlanticum]